MCKYPTHDLISRNLKRTNIRQMQIMKINFKKSHFSNFEQLFLTSNKGKQSTHTEQPDLFNQKNDPQKYFKQKNNV